MKPAALLLGLICIVAAPWALGKPEAAKPALKKPVATNATKAKPLPSRKPQKPVPPAKPIRAAAKPKTPVAVPARPVKPAEKPPEKPAMPADKPAEKIGEVPGDTRELVNMPSPARLALRAEMRDRMAALDTVLQLMTAGKTAEAGEVARDRLGVAVWSSHRKLPAAARPEQYMSPAMQVMAFDGYKAASDFATVAVTGDQATANALLAQLTGSCAQCHKAYRVR